MKSRLVAARGCRMHYWADPRWPSGNSNKPPVPGTVLDEAMIMGRVAESLPAATEDDLRDMDRGVQLTTNEVKGRNTWIVWTGGNDRFWDYMASHMTGRLIF